MSTGDVDMDPKQKPYKFVVRLPLQLRNQIADAATYYRRSQNSEIVTRLEQSFSGISAASQGASVAPPMHEHIESLFGRTLSTEEEKILHAYRRLPAEKKAALVELLS